MQRPPNIYDVADLAGVSHQTVSRVLNKSDKVSPSTRDRVEVAIRTLGYQRNNAARSLVTSKTRIIGVVITNTGYFGPSNTIRAMEEQARSNGYFAISASVDPESSSSIEAGIQQMRILGAEALVLIAPQIISLRLVRPFLSGIPIVVMANSNEPGLFSVRVDDYQGAKKATEYLIESGHTKLAHVSGPKDWFEAEARMKGFSNACEEADLIPSLIYRGSWDSISGYQSASEVFSSGATAVFCANDQLAIGLIRGLNELGLSVPQDISIVGYDDMPEARYLNPPLTTIRQDFDELGRRIMALLIEELRDQTAIRKEMIEPELVIRESVKNIS